MLSILIPTYNYDAFPLVKELHQQALLEGLVFEIIVSDDASTDQDMIALNREITKLSYCQYHLNNKNLGRGANRNQLAQLAKFDWVLFLDSDTMPISKSFVRNYLDCVAKNKSSVCFGGIAYKANKPTNDELLRWTFGRKREAIPVSKRQEKMYGSAFVSNILLARQVLIDYPFHSSIYDYGFEDFAFINQLRKKGLLILHIDNPVLHLNLEKSEVFLQKHLSAIENLNTLINKSIILDNETRLSKLRTRLRRFGLCSLLVFIFHTFEKIIRKNLTSNRPSLLLFDLYKLGYFCSLKES